MANRRKERIQQRRRTAVAVGGKSRRRQYGRTHAAPEERKQGSRCERNSAQHGVIHDPAVIILDVFIARGPQSAMAGIDERCK